MTDSSLTASVKCLGFDVFGTVVDWRNGVARALGPFLLRQGYADLDPFELADAWRALYQPSMETVRSGRREWTRLGVLNRENLEQVLRRYGLSPEAVDAAELDELNRAWERLDPWPDSVEALQRLKTRFAIVTMSNGSIGGMMNLARFGGLPWDAILGAEPTHGYKPQPQVYLGSADILGLRPDQLMMVAAHNDDLRAARRCGLRTAFVLRQREHGEHQRTDLQAEEAWDVAGGSLLEIAEQLGC